jgi:protein TonB
MNPETYQNIVTMESSNWQAGQARKLRGFPLRALIVSLLLHALLLLVLAPQFVQAPVEVLPAPMLQGVLVPVPLPASAATAAAVAPIAEFAPVARNVPRLTRELVPEARQTVSAEATPVANSPTAVPPPVPVAGVMAAPTIHSSPTPDKVRANAGVDGRAQAMRLVPGPATAALPLESEERGLNAAGLRQFRLALAGEARQFRRYPAAARLSELTGTAEVRVTVESGGIIRRVDLSRSSGHGVLDKAALEMLRQAVPRADLPESLRGRGFTVLLPVVFEVEE